MKNYYKFNPETMQFEKSHEKRNLILLVCIAFAALLAVQCVKTDEGDTIYPKQDKVQQNAQIYPDSIFEDSTIRHYQKCYGFYIQVKAFEKQYYYDSLKEVKRK